MKCYIIRLFFTGDKEVVKTEIINAENPFEAKDIVIKKYGGKIIPKIKGKTFEILSKIEIVSYNTIN
ncbi:conserved hypothetical protein [Methanococcus vannielii SB]|jgi:hypothetical protein|uniref:Uncharacterized protein n=1 Tax=Methanococcus vannielii (strain ATCC 35089 / DSM 1224 / JCM 13029 / OCM 148 / SB) TaxID=406327 RepID=A6UPY3_METVS|nr:hypothetical protein [Methanococcus vannielii]ABR54555.1 conserved hypothetical protein [Methanococcus vannielii SB]